MTLVAVLWLVAPPAGRTAVPVSTTNQNTWVGTWRTPKGTVDIQQAGTLVAGVSNGYRLLIAGTLDSATVTVGGLEPVRGHTFSGTWDEAPTHTGPDHAGTLKLVLAADGRTFNGTWTVAHSPADRLPGFTGTCLGGDCLLNTRLVLIESVSNGCGGGPWKALAAAQNVLADKHTYKNSNINPLAASFMVDFRDACNLHDAGYSGAVVRDKLHGGAIVDYRSWARQPVDVKFLQDMQLLCDRQIPAGASTARANCKARGGNVTFGAGSLYAFVREQGFRFFDADLARPNDQPSGPRDNR